MVWADDALSEWLAGDARWACHGRVNGGPGRRGRAAVRAPIRDVSCRSVGHSRARWPSAPWLLVRLQIARDKVRGEHVIRERPLMSELLVELGVDHDAVAVQSTA